MSPTPPLDGDILITGASSGIGEAIARQLAGRARRLVLVARRADRLDALATELRAQRSGLLVEVRCCDLVDAEQRQQLLDALADDAPVDVLVNNAGFGDQSLFDRTRWDKLDRMVSLNITALTHLTHGLLPGMVERGRGGVLNISSGFGLSWLPGLAVYIGTKHYVTGFTETLRAEVRDQGIAVTQVCPGPVMTEFHDLTENTTGQRPPKFVAISAQQCASEALDGFERGGALVVPGFILRNLLRLHAGDPSLAVAGPGGSLGACDASRIVGLAKKRNRSTRDDHCVRGARCRDAAVWPRRTWGPCVRDDGTLRVEQRSATCTKNVEEIAANLGPAPR